MYIGTSPKDPPGCMACCSGEPFPTDDQLVVSSVSL